ncbi:hypothetical protein FBY41_0152 [Humibacillus xanthopallidus]|uniref:Uncharacterized protein n=1 Tax=Humibacillus xanthopallidus TaxID=412689 RepID=A0A543HZQ3_9MICO|nr:hypothetical protein FBY41_0152 [Humibacillus xanthopallidus]
MPLVDLAPGQRKARPALGALVTFSQSWFPIGTALGQLLHSLALAPGESTRVAVIDWARQLKSSLTDTSADTDVLVSDVVRARSLSEVTRAVAYESQHGSSASQSRSWGSGAGFSAGYGTGTGAAGKGSYGRLSLAGAAGDALGIGVSAGKSSAGGSTFSWASTSGMRDVAAEATQRLTDSTHQASSLARSHWASSVREVSQSEQEEISTRAVTNYNHLHALTIEYFEVVQLYRVISELVDVVPALFIPIQDPDFTDTSLIVRYRDTLASAALTPEIASLIDRVGSSVLRFPRVPSIVPVEQSSWQKGFGANTAFADRLLLPVGYSSVSSSLGLVSAPYSCIDALEVTYLDGSTKVISPSTVWPDAAPHRVAYWSSIPGPADIRSLKVRQTSPEGATGVLAVNYTIRTAETSAFTVHVIIEGLKRAETMVPILEVQTLSPEEDRRLRGHLVAHSSYYQEAIVRSVDASTWFRSLSAYTFSGKPLLNVCDPDPITVTGGYVVLAANIEDDPRWQSMLKQTKLRSGVSRETVVPLPSGGVFAEAVLGRSTGAEKLDMTRFWNWADSPIPISAPEIAAQQSGSRAQQGVESVKIEGQAPSSLTIMTPPPAPDFAGTAAILAAVNSGGMFRDMSGLAATIGAAQAGLSGALTAAQGFAGEAGENARAAIEAASKNLSSAAGMLSGGASGGSTASAGTRNGQQTVSATGARLNEARRLDDQAGTISVVKPGATSTPRQDGVLGFDGGGSAAAPTAPGAPTGQPGAGSPTGQLTGRKAWPGLDATTVLTRIHELSADANKVDQGQVGLCTAAAFLHHAIQRNSGDFQKFAEALYGAGVGYLGELKVAPGSDLRATDFHALVQKYGPMPPQADWMVMSALRDSENWFFDYEGAPDETIAMSTSAKELSEWYEETGYYSSVRICDDRDDAEIGGLRRTTDNHLALWIRTSLLHPTYDGTHIITVESPVSVDPTANTASFDYWTWGQPIKTLITTYTALRSAYLGAITATF